MTSSPSWPTPALVALPDEQILAHAARAGRALVTANIKDFIPLDTRYRAASRRHAGLILVSAKTFLQARSYTTAVISALLDQSPPFQPGQVAFLRAHDLARRPAWKAGRSGHRTAIPGWSTTRPDSSCAGGS